MLIRVFSLLCFILVLGACSSWNTKTLVPEVSVIKSEPNGIRFSGKGAGAGMMLMSSMGPSGIAIGVAIDEGIGKTIDETATANNIDFTELIGQAFNQKITTHNLTQESDKTAIKAATLEITRYGFISTNGDNDPVIAEYHLRYQLNNNAWQSFNFPSDIATNKKTRLLTKSLEQVKTDAAAIRVLIADGLSYFDIKSE